MDASPTYTILYRYLHGSEGEAILFRILFSVIGKKERKPGKNNGVRVNLCKRVATALCSFVVACRSQEFSDFLTTTHTPPSTRHNLRWRPKCRVMTLWPSRFIYYKLKTLRSANYKSANFKIMQWFVNRWPNPSLDKSTKKCLKVITSVYKQLVSGNLIQIKASQVWHWLNV